jgi:hypothetical protein
MATTRNKKRSGILLPGNTYVTFNGYADIYSSLKVLLGLKDLDSDQISGTRIQAPVSAVPGIARIRVRYKVTGNKTKIGTVICTPGKMEEALGENGLTKQKYKNQEITEAYLPRRRVYVA